MLLNLLSRPNVTNKICLGQCSGSKTFRMDPDPDPDQGLTDPVLDSYLQPAALIFTDYYYVRF